ncbi:ferrochelatase [Actinopolyspora saharensis]|uniref:Coproporphyrin III ferrochelatase n=1 Tax=Actinopolyspora saharensis TaxID=995062 RepID=A0A1H0ZKU9_9ACTN|nr:ferrochelatase [Actinopolyspora saharensis]SDQ28135.1 ferrochelatase [Actinopolyspora saharensis]
MNSSEDFDALLYLSFGGPEGHEEVRPFLENVTRGRDVPPERLDEVAEHYHHFGGVSPINRLNRDIMGSLDSTIAERGWDLPIYFGNRNWHPMIEDTVERMAADGVRKALVFATSAWGGYSGCRQYHEDIARARAAVGEDRAPELVKLRQFYDHPLFIAANADAVTRAYAQLPAESRSAARLVFTAHSVPLSAEEKVGPDGRAHWYSRQVHETARLVAEAVGVADYDVVWQSRSGPPSVPWLEPDVCDHLDQLHGRDVPAVVISPIGFVSDHLEVVWDLDNEAADKASELGMGFARAATAGTDPRYARMIGELVSEHLEDHRVRKLSPLVEAGCTTNGQFCIAQGCC